MPNADPIQFDNFDLHFRPVEPPAEGYHVYASSPRAGEASARIGARSASTEGMPIQGGDEGGAIESGRRRREIVAAGVAAQIDTTFDARTAGERLYDAFFVEPIRARFEASLDIARREGRGLRIRLHLADAPELAALPWECLYRNSGHDTFFALSAHTPVVRYLDLPQPVQPLSVCAPLGVLAVVSDPDPRDVPRLDVASEWRHLNAALAALIDDGLVTLERLDRGRDSALTALQRRLRADPTAYPPIHIVHFAGHGHFDPENGRAVLALEAADGRADIVEADRIGRLLHDGPSVRLVVLNACRGAQSSPADAFAGAAQTIVRQSVPAVIAMREAVSDDAAKAFAAEFYTAIKDGYPVDAALGEARKAMRIDGLSAEWATPAIVLHAADTTLLTLKRLAPVGYGIAGIALGESEPPGRPQRLASPAAVGFDDPGLLDRQLVLDAIDAALASHRVVEVRGESGIGKSALLRHLAYHPPAGTYPDGIVFQPDIDLPLGDVLDDLYRRFFVPPAGTTLRLGEIRQRLAAIAALVLIDGGSLDGDDLDALLASAPRCHFVVASQDRRVWRGGRSIPLNGLAANDARVLIERTLGRPLAGAGAGDGGDEVAAGERLAESLGGHPHAIEIVVATEVVDGGRSLPAVADAVTGMGVRRGRFMARGDDHGTDAARTATSRVVTHLPVHEQSVLSALATQDGSPLTAEHVGALTGIVDVATVLARLVRRRLVQTHSPRYSVRRDVQVAAVGYGTLNDWRHRSITHFATWAEANRDAPDRLLESIGALRGAQRTAVDLLRDADAVRLARALDGALAASGRWALWGDVLDDALAAAMSSGDSAAEAWARHQLGTRAASMGDVRAARGELTDALRLREALGDEVGTAVTRGNLAMLGAPWVAPAVVAWRDRARLRRYAQIAMGVGALVVALALGWWAMRTPPNPIPPDDGAARTATAAAWATATAAAGGSFGTAVVTAGQTPSATPSPTRTSTRTPSPTPSPTPTLTSTSTSTPTDTATASPTATRTPTAIPTRTPTGTSTPMASITFEVDRKFIVQGECVVFRWRVDNIDQVYFDGEPEVGHGSSKECPNGTRTYTLVVVKRDGSKEERNITIEVRQLSPLAAPSGLSCNVVQDPVGGWRADIGWTDNSADESEFHIERAVYSGGWGEIGTVGAGATSFADPGTQRRLFLSYRVRAHRHADGAFSGYSNEGSCQTQ